MTPAVELWVSDYTLVAKGDTARWAEKSSGSPCFCSSGLWKYVSAREAEAEGSAAVCHVWSSVGM